MTIRATLRSPRPSRPPRRRFKVALSSTTGAGTVFLWVIAQGAQGGLLVLLASTAAVLGGVSAVSGYSSMHRPRTTRPLVDGTDDAIYVPPSNVPASSRYFRGRNSELDAVSRALGPNEPSDGVRVCVVHGRGGLGKTQLAITYAKRWSDEHQSLVWWLYASSYERLLGELLDLAACLDIPDHSSKSVILNKLWGRLRDYPGWLLVYDNVQGDSLGPLNEEADDVRPSLVPTVGNGAVLVTTQRREGWEDLRGASVEPIALPDMDAEDGLALLRARIGAADDERALRDLGAQLHWLPLALTQAASYIADAQISVEDYLHRLPDHSVGSPATTYRLSIERICADEPVAEDLMRLCSFFAPEDVREETLLQHLTVIPSPLREVMEDQAAFNRVVRRLSDHSLFSRSGDRRATGVVYAMHPQVQASVRTAMDEQTRLQWSQTVVLLLEAAFPHAPDRLSERAACEGLMPHVEAVCEAMTQEAQEGLSARDAGTLARLLHRAGAYQDNRCDWVHALEYFKREATLRETRPGDVLNLATARLAVARQHYLLARIDVAEAHCRLALDQCLQRPNDATFLPLQAQCLRQLGGILLENIQFDKALNAVGQAIQIYEQHGAEWQGLDRAAAEEEAGLIHRNAGALTEARACFESAEKSIPESSRGEPEEYVVFCAGLRRDEGILRQDSGELMLAAENLSAALSKFRENRGADDFETSQVAKFLADIRRRQGEEARYRADTTHNPFIRRRRRREALAYLREAADLLDPVVELHRKRSSAEGHKYAACLNKLGSLQHAQGQTEQALETLREAESIYLAKYGPEHHYLAKTLSRLGPVLLSAGDRPGAEETLLEAKKIFTTRLGMNHPSLVAVYERLVLCTTDADRIAEYRADAQKIRDRIRAEEVAAAQTRNRTAGGPTPPPS
ncbi:tetratricopeptide repeat protein [Streptomyces prunicolor]|uniref:tetratricopeptide repeat protein n=1 Tax=Streptomyces prunicolor TaxID=67348 RepID=UPI0037D5F76C